MPRSAVLFFTWIAVACSPAQQTKVETAGLNLAICVLQHSTLPPEQIAAQCGAAALSDVSTILNAHQAAERAELAQAKGRTP